MASGAEAVDEARGEEVIKLKCPYCGEFAEVEVVVVGDYECQGCKRWFRVLKKEP